MKKNIIAQNDKYFINIVYLRKFFFFLKNDFKENMITNWEGLQIIQVKNNNIKKIVQS